MPLWTEHSYKDSKDDMKMFLVLSVENTTIVGIRRTGDRHTTTKSHCKLSSRKQHKFIYIQTKSHLTEKLCLRKQCRNLQSSNSETLAVTLEWLNTSSQKTSAVRRVNTVLGDTQQDLRISQGAAIHCCRGPAYVSANPV